MHILRPFRIFSTPRDLIFEIQSRSNHWKIALKNALESQEYRFCRIVRAIRVIRTSNGIKMEEQARGWRINGFENQESLR